MSRNHAASTGDIVPHLCPSGSDQQPHAYNVLVQRLNQLPCNADGYCIPRIAKKNAAGEFEIAGYDEDAVRDVCRFQLCALCGIRLGSHRTAITTVIGGVHRVAASVLYHGDCAFWALGTYPHLRRDDELHVLWTSKVFLPFDLSEKNKLRRQAVEIGSTAATVPAVWHMGEPTRVEFKLRGCSASRADIEAEMERRVPPLLEAAMADTQALKMLQAKLQLFRTYLPREVES